MNQPLCSRSLHRGSSRPNIGGKALRFRASEGNVLTGIHILLTLKCTNECDHCFLHCGPSCEATFTVGQLQTLVRQIEQLGTVTTVYFEGGEPFLFYPLLLEGLRGTGNGINKRADGIGLVVVCVGLAREFGARLEVES